MDLENSIIEKKHDLTVKVKRGLPGIVNDQRVSAVADTGAGQNVVSAAFARSLNLPVTRKRTTFQLGNSKFVKSIGTTALDWSFLGEPSTAFSVVCHVLSDCAYDLILSRPFLHATETLTKFRYRLQVCKFRVKNLLQFGFRGSDSQWLRGRLGNGSAALALADSGAERNVMNYDFAVSQGFEIDYRPNCRGSLQFADGTVQHTVGQVTTSWTFEDGQKIFETFEVLKNCIVDVVLGEDVLWEHDVFNLHASSLVPMDMDGGFPELAPFDYFERFHFFKKGKQQAPSHTPNHGSDYATMVAEERARRTRWDFATDFGDKASPQQKEAEYRRRADFDSQHAPSQPGQGFPRISALAASGTGIAPLANRAQPAHPPTQHRPAASSS